MAVAFRMAWQQEPVKDWGEAAAERAGAGAACGRCQVLASCAASRQAADGAGGPCGPTTRPGGRAAWYYPVQGADPGGMAGDALVQADDHHPAPCGAVGVQLVELVDSCCS